MSDGAVRPDVIQRLRGSLETPREELLPRWTFASETEDAMEVECAVLTVEEAGRVLGICRGAAYLAVHRGDIPVIRLGRRIVVPKKALAKLLDGRRVGS